VSNHKALSRKCMKNEAKQHSESPHIGKTLANRAVG